MGLFDGLSSMGLKVHYSATTFSMIRESLRPVARVRVLVSFAAGFASCASLSPYTLTT